MSERTEAQCIAQHRNFCIFLVKGARAHRTYLSRAVSAELLRELDAVQDKILAELEANNGKA